MAARLPRSLHHRRPQPQGSPLCRIIRASRTCCTANCISCNCISSRLSNKPDSRRPQVCCCVRRCTLLLPWCVPYSMLPWQEDVTTRWFRHILIQFIDKSTQLPAGFRCPKITCYTRRCAPRAWQLARSHRRRLTQQRSHSHTSHSMLKHSCLERCLKQRCGGLACLGHLRWCVAPSSAWVRRYWQRALRCSSASPSCATVVHTTRIRDMDLVGAYLTTWP
jgi:hypothetical protein